MTIAITPLGVAALALLMERPMHPYEMYQTLIQRTEDSKVKVRPGSLYHTIDRMTAHGLVRAVGTDRDGNRPERTTYEVTESGQLALTERISEMLAVPVNEFPEFPVAIGEAHNLPADTVTVLLEQRLERLRADRTMLTLSVDAVTMKKLERKLWIDLSYRCAVLDAEISWISGFVAELKAGDIPW